MAHPTILPIETPTLGDRSYLVHDGEVAFVIDPQRDIDRVLDLAAAEGVRITHVFETHIHNDYVTGGLALAARTGAAYFVNGADEVAYDRTPISDGDEVQVGGLMRLRALATPGHTFTHLSYALTADGEPVAVFTGGSLLYGATGRPDLLGHEHTHDLVHAQYASAHRLASELPDATEVFPTHGFGSFCSATQSDATDSTIGQEKQNNPALTESEETYVAELLAGLDAYPAYYVHMAPANAAGPTAPDLSLPAMAKPEELRRRIEAGEWVVDLRNRTMFAAGHMPGTLNFGIDGGFATYLGWLIEWGTPLTLLGETEADVARAQRELVRIGIDRPAASATGGPEIWSDRPLSSFRQATFADLDLVRHHRDVVILDVRREPEFAAARIEGALNIPLHELPKRVHEVPDAGEVWVHCAGGYRAAVAASFLSAANRKLVAIDDTFDNAKASGLHLITAEDDADQDDPHRQRRRPEYRGEPRQGRRPVMIRKLLALFPRPATMTAAEAHQAVTSDGAVLLDVREQTEWRAGHAPQARHLVLGQLQDHLGELPTDRPIVTVCRSGRRSAIAANTLTRHGYQATNLTGGMNAWASAGLPVITNDGKPGRVI